MTGDGGFDEFVGSDGILRDVHGGNRWLEAALLGTPAFIRRARSVELAIEALFARVAAERRHRSRVLWVAARPLAAWVAGLAEGPAHEAAPDWLVRCLGELRSDSDFDRRRAPSPRRRPERHIDEFAARVEAWNSRWSGYLASVSLADVHRVEDEYNRYYLIERQAAIPHAPNVGWRPRQLFDREELARRYPGLPTPRRATPA